MKVVEEGGCGYVIGVAINATILEYYTWET